MFMMASEEHYNNVLSGEVLYRNKKSVFDDPTFAD